MIEAAFRVLFPPLMSTAIHRRVTIVLVIAMSAWIAGALAATPQWQPERAIEIVVGVTPGGPLDVSARLLQKIATDHQLVGAPISVMNKPGANNALAWIYLNQHPGDAHYIAMTLPNIITNRITGVHPLNYGDVTPLAQLNSEYIAFTVKPDSPIRSGKDLLERLRQNPASLSIAFSNIGSANHIGAGVLFKGAGLDVKKAKLVAFKGVSEAVTALLGGHVDAIASSASSVLPQVQSGQLRAVAVAAPKRLSGALATVPTWKEQGVNALFANWRGIVGPRGLTPSQIAYWDAVIGKVVHSDEWLREVEKRGWESDYLNSVESRRFLERQNDELKGLLGDLGLAK